MDWWPITPNVYLAFISTFLFAIYWLQRKKVPKGLKLPPGPRGYPIIGNYLDLPKTHEWKTYQHWADIYGDLVYLTMFGTGIAIVNSQELATELFDKRSAIYSDRHYLPMLCGLMKFDWTMSLIPYGDRWRKHRQMFNKQFIPATYSLWRSKQTKYTRDLLQRLLVSPSAFLPHIRHAIGALILESTYGINVLPENDPNIILIEETLSTASRAAQPGTYLVDAVPILKYIPEWVPGAGFQKDAKAGCKLMTDAAELPFRAVKTMIASGRAEPSITAAMLDELELNSQATPEEEEVIRNVAGSVYTGGIDTTDTAMNIFVLAMVLYPEVQLTAQKALDEVVGSDRFPTLDDRQELPYITALCKEVLRWHLVMPIGLPHRLEQDDIVGNHFLPAGTIIAGNAWRMLHSDKAYGSNPDTFRPERFLVDGAKDPEPAFGFGRRICPGRGIAQDMLWMFVASILHSFTISPDPKKGCPSRDAFISGIISRPFLFECKIVPRSSAHERLIRMDMPV